MSFIQPIDLHDADTDCAARAACSAISRATLRDRDIGRAALPAGSTVTWGLLTSGTMLAGANYPYPIFN